MIAPPDIPWRWEPADNDGPRVPLYPPDYVPGPPVEDNRPQWSMDGFFLCSESGRVALLGMIHAPSSSEFHRWAGQQPDHWRWNGRLGLTLWGTPHMVVLQILTGGTPEDLVGEIPPPLIHRDGLMHFPPIPELETISQETL